MGPILSVERFLQASNARDLDSMGNIFGTADGPAMDTGGTFGCMFKKMGSWIGLGDRCVTRQEVELELSLIAELLRHEDFRVVSESRVAGRTHPTTRVGVNFVIDGRDILDVPFFVVHAKSGRWLIENIDLAKVTG